MKKQHGAQVLCAFVRCGVHTNSIKCCGKLADEQQCNAVPSGVRRRETGVVLCNRQRTAPLVETELPKSLHNGQKW